MSLENYTITAHLYWKYINHISITEFWLQSWSLNNLTICSCQNFNKSQHNFLQKYYQPLQLRHTILYLFVSSLDYETNLLHFGLNSECLIFVKSIVRNCYLPDKKKITPIYHYTWLNQGSRLSKNSYNNSHDISHYIYSVYCFLYILP